MTETEWLDCTDIKPMLDFLGNRRTSERKLRLFAVACSRRMWERRPTLLRGRTDRATIEIAERYADGQVTSEELDAVWRGASRPEVRNLAIYSIRGIERLAAYTSEKWANTEARYVTERQGSEAGDAAGRGEREAHAVLLHDIFGNPFRPIAVEPAWLSWNDGTIPKLAQAIYDDRAFDRMPILADALEEAGCANPDVLSHCRSQSDHVRGCWLIDLLLNKG